MNDPSDIRATDDLIAQIRLLARDEKLPPERQLAERLQVNRYVLRKALSQLRRTDEIPPSRPRRPARNAVQRRITDLTSPAEVWEMRLLLEPEIARLAAVRGTIGELEAIRAAHEAAEPDVFDLDHDVAFHLAIATASHNALALHLIDGIIEITRDPSFRAKFPPFTIETGWRHHDQLTDAICSRRAAEAESVMRNHLTAILQWLNGDAGPARYSVK